MNGWMDEFYTEGPFLLPISAVHIHLHINRERKKQKTTHEICIYCANYNVSSREKRRLFCQLFVSTASILSRFPCQRIHFKSADVPLSFQFINFYYFFIFWFFSFFIWLLFVFNFLIFTIDFIANCCHCF